jgi:hypothetical protein
MVCLSKRIQIQRLLNLMDNMSPLDKLEALLEKLVRVRQAIV